MTRIIKIENLINDNPVSLGSFLAADQDDIEQIRIASCSYCVMVRCRTKDRDVAYESLLKRIRSRKRKAAQPREKELAAIMERSLKTTNEIDIVLTYLLEDGVADASALEASVNKLMKQKNPWERFAARLARAKAGTAPPYFKQMMEETCQTADQRNFCQMPLLSLFRVAKLAGLPVPIWFDGTKPT